VQERREVVNQRGETDAQLLCRLARECRRQFYVDTRGLHWRKPSRAAAPAHVWVWRGGEGMLLSLGLDCDLSIQSHQVEVKGRDPLRKETYGAKASGDRTPRPTLGETRYVPDADGRHGGFRAVVSKAETRPASEPSQERAQQAADAAFATAEQEMVKLSAQLLGDPMVMAGDVVELRGVPPLLAGKYYIERAKHDVSASGYLCDVKLTRDGFGASPHLLAQGGQRNEQTARAPGQELSARGVINAETGKLELVYEKRSTR
jgi:phage protein D